MMKGHLRHGRVALGQSLGSLRTIALDQKSISTVVGAVTPVCHLYLLKDVCFIIHAQVLFRYKSIIATLAFIQFCFFLSFALPFLIPTHLIKLMHIWLFFSPSLVLCIL